MESTAWRKEDAQKQAVVSRDNSQNECSMPFRGRGQARTELAVRPPGSGAGGDRASGGESGFADKAGNVESAGQDVGQERGLGGVGKTEPGRTFHAVTGLVGVAALGIALATQAQFPGGRADQQVTGEADVATREVKVHSDQEA